MAGLAPLLVRTLQALPREGGLELLEELRRTATRLSEAEPRTQAQMAKALIAALRQANPE